MTKIKKGTKKPRNGQWEKRVAVYISQEDFDQLCVLASHQGHTVSSFARKVLQDEIRK